MQDFSHQHLNSISIKPDITLLLEYSEPDQGGTRLLHRFCISQNGEIAVETGYSHEDDFQKSRASVGEVPQQVFNDALDWITQQLEYSPSGGILDVLKGFQKTISSF